MKTDESSLQKSFNIHHSCLLFIFISYMLDIISSKLGYLNLRFLDFLIIIPFRIYFYSGVYGTLTELISGQEIVLRRDAFRQNAKKYWKFFLILSVTIFLVHLFIIFFFFKAKQVSIYAFFAHMHIASAFFFARHIMQTKYIHPLNLSKRPLHATPKIVLTILSLLTIQLFFFYLPSILIFQNFELSRFTLFIHNYLIQLIFIYFAVILTNFYPEIRKSFQHEKEIYLINPLSGGLIQHYSSTCIRSYPPIFAIIKALSPKQYKFREINRLPWRKHYLAKNKLVAITCYSTNASSAYRIALEYKKAGSTVIIGGPHVSFLPDEALEFCDSVVIGEAESVWQEIISDYEANTLKNKYVGIPLQDCYQKVYKELLMSPPAVIKDYLETSRGCKFNCRFCAVPSISNGQMRTRAIPEIVALIKKIKHKYRNITFIDNNIYSNPAYSQELFTALKPLKIKWATQCSIDIAKNDKLLQLAKDSGCAALLIGFEISGDSSEKDQGGKLAMSDNFAAYARKIKRMGIKIKAHFIFGFESDNLATLFRIWKFCFTVFPTFGAFSILTPFPGTMVYKDMLREDRITNLNWNHYTCQSLVFHHDRMNNYLLARLWPAICTLFFLTTSWIGLLLFLLILLDVLGLI